MHARSGPADAAPREVVPHEVATADHAVPGVRGPSSLRPAPVIYRAALVGHVDDPAEHEAERRADEVVAILRRRASRPDPDDEGPAPEPRLDRLRRRWSGAVDTHTADPHATDTHAIDAHVDRYAGALPARPSHAPAPIARVHSAAAAPIGPSGGPLDADTQQQVERLRGGGRPLPADVRAPMESALGADLSRVRVHSGQHASALSAQLGAQAFTVGDDVVFGGGLPDIRHDAGARLWAHELTHVVQQHGGGPRRTPAQVTDPASAGATTDALTSTPTDGTAPAVRRITSVANFKTATPASTRHPRKSIRTIDDRLSDYIGSTGAARVPALQALVAACTAYLTAGAHSGGRTAAVTALQAEANAELPLLQALGAANADLLEDVVRRAGGGALIGALTQVATHLTPAEANLLPRLVDAVGGGAGLADLDALVQALHPVAQAAHLPALIAASPGALNHLAPLLDAALGNVADLLFLVPRAGGGNQATLDALTAMLGPAVPHSALTSFGGHTEKLIPMATLANGTQATFLRMAQEAPHFKADPLPGQPGGLALDLPRTVFDTAAPGAPPGPDPGVYTNAKYQIRWGHFFSRHVRSTFRFNEIKLINTFWPAGWTNAEMLTVVNAWLTAAAAAGYYMGGPTAATDRRAPANFNAGVASPLSGNNVLVRGGVFKQPPVPTTLPSIEQFFPLSAAAAGQAAEIVDISADELRAIQAAVT